MSSSPCLAFSVPSVMHSPPKVRKGKGKGRGGEKRGERWRPPISRSLPPRCGLRGTAKAEPRPCGLAGPGRAQDRLRDDGIPQRHAAKDGEARAGAGIVRCPCGSEPRGNPFPASRERLCRPLCGGLLLETVIFLALSVPERHLLEMLVEALGTLLTGGGCGSRRGLPIAGPSRELRLLHAPFLVSSSRMPTAWPGSFRSSNSDSLFDQRQ